MEVAVDRINLDLGQALFGEKCKEVNCVILWFTKMKMLINSKWEQIL